MMTAAAAFVFEERHVYSLRSAEASRYGSSRAMWLRSAEASRYMHSGPTTRVVVFRIALCAVGFRVVSAILAFLVNVVFRPAQPAPVTMFGVPSAFWDPFTRFDAGWYYQIARYGYLFVPGGPSAGVGKAGKIAYFPLYPLLMRYAGRLFGHAAADVYLGGILVSWAAFTAAMVALFFLARLDLPRVRAERSALLTAIFPFSFFFGMVYTESLFLLLTVLAFYAFRTRRWVLGGVCGGLASATRVNGILLLPALAWIAWRNAEPTPRDRLLAAIGLLLVTSGIGIYSLYVYQISGNPLEWAIVDQPLGVSPRRLAVARARASPGAARDASLSVSHN